MNIDEMMKEKYINDEIMGLINDSEDLFAKGMVDKLNDFYLIANHTGNFTLKSVSNKSLKKLLKRCKSKKEANTLIISIAIRELEGFQVIYFMKSYELIGASLHNLKNNQIIASAICARALLELSVKYLYNSNRINNIFNEFPWDKMDKNIYMIHIGAHKDDKEPIFDFTERMLWGGRMGTEGHLYEKNILTYIEKIEKNLKSTKAGWSLEDDYYKVLCEVTHPNAFGMMSLESSGDITRVDGWVMRRYSIKNKRNNRFKEFMIPKICGTISISADMMINGFNIIQKEKMIAHKNIGYILPLF